MGLVGVGWEGERRKGRRKIGLFFEGGGELVGLSSLKKVEILVLC